MHIAYRELEEGEMTLSRLGANSNRQTMLWGELKYMNYARAGMNLPLPPQCKCIDKCHDIIYNDNGSTTSLYEQYTNICDNLQVITEMRNLLTCRGSSAPITLVYVGAISYE